MAKSRTIDKPQRTTYRNGIFLKGNGLVRMQEIMSRLMRFFGMYAPSQSVRVAMYRKAGIRIGRVREFGGNVWLSINFRNLLA